MNTASRMESTGRANRIQVSQDTADLLKASGKGQWVVPREEMIQVKGKGMMVSYWLSASGRSDASSVAGSSVAGDSTTDATSLSGESVGGASSDINDGGVVVSVGPEKLSHNEKTDMDVKTASLVKWNVNMLSTIIQKIAVQNMDITSGAARRNDLSIHSDSEPSGTVLDEVKEVIELPHFSGSPTQDWRSVELKPEVTEQLQDLISGIASMYQQNFFHNFEHASHVSMAVMKLTTRVVNPKIDGVNVQSHEASMLHDYTYGITSDPLLQFACMFSAVIHDADHPGVPNSTLIKENSQLAQVYKKSTAEQNSFDLAWALFMDDKYSDLRNALCRDEGELKRFRQMVVNMVMATDVIDKDLNGFRNKRWSRAFGSEADLEEAEKDKVDRKATIVVEHMIQAADVAHTMQHWHIYRKWNERLFCEMYEAFTSGRSETNPADGWYDGELGFFDFYIIPLAKKLADCGVFGVASSEYLSYAERNRREWADRGREIVAEYVEGAKKKLMKKQLKHQDMADVRL
uniref:PDEase domain-containing protein n=1 Tax=Entomoneis paludosa TaxID=265537 RepID=A0A7S2YCQ1_9STRA|mmetsp:Transcript_27263/g.57107  ORF Transcript_27263/g.57107 Transcript_27263/m.57107 type:complete len:518 (+) Transcript_27263:87-1640(+)